MSATRQLVLASANECLAKQNAASTISSYESLRNSLVGDAQRQLETTLLPLDSDERFLSLFSFLKAKDPDLKWSRVQSLKTALVKYHARVSMPCVFDNWNPLMRAFWTGLSRQCSHSSCGKEPIMFPAMVNVLEKLSQTNTRSSTRMAARVVVGCFGVGRCAKTLAFIINDVSGVVSTGFSLKVRCQRNDQEGIGMTCIIPDIPALGCVPQTLLLQNWLQARMRFAKSSNAEEPLLCNVTGNSKSVGNKVSADSFRKALSGLFQGNTSTHSLRKGGAKFYAAANSPEQATMLKGGWRTSETMRSIYTSLTKSEVSAAISKAAVNAGHAYVIKRSTMSLSSISKDSLLKDSRSAIDYINLVKPLIGKVPWPVLVENKVAVFHKKLTSHEDEVVRQLATSSYGKLRSAWAVHKALTHKSP